MQKPIGLYVGIFATGYGILAKKHLNESKPITYMYVQSDIGIETHSHLVAFYV